MVRISSDNGRMGNWRKERGVGGETRNENETKDESTHLPTICSSSLTGSNRKHQWESRKGGSQDDEENDGIIGMG